MRQKKPAPDMYLPKAEREQKQESTIALKPCIVCKKPIHDGYFGSYQDGGVCSKVCDVLHMKRSRDEMFNHPASTPLGVRSQD